MNLSVDGSHRSAVLFWAVNVAATLIILFLVIEPIYAAFTQRTQFIEQRIDELSRFQRLAAEDKSVRALLQEVREEKNTGIFLVGLEADAANASLQAHLKERVEKAGLSLRSVAGLEPHTEQGVNYLGAKLDLSGSINALHAAIRAIEGGLSPVLFVRGLTIRAPASIPREHQSQEVILNIQMEVYGAIQTSEAF
ncbi:hypothetical protein HFO02_36025 [Rhizobium laguerreae]|uniref:type II secretion system protein GspM n=1 Tax=Rhizobium laguerreae TaxID=1076926 RepID=UPI001C8FB19D|nr:type II secretion system protein GspM [Rhizobium laguerreae]MBY3328888.1 hypothetical protein [Rhizobium laguerreae]